uniref:Uncoupling protein 3 n=1 Tax=Anolis carolinensis TaxID=28377 RepID=A0A803TMG3_ANOCA
MVGLKPTEMPPSATVKFLSAGTAACIADLCTFPLDTAKVRLQIQGESKSSRAAKDVRYKGVFGTITTMVKMEGPRSLYNGLVAGLQRQMSFASIRIGLYDSVKQFYTPKGSDNASILTRLLAGCTTGAMAVTCAQPTDVVKVRFQAHIGLAGGPKKYNGTVDAYRTIAREEGVRGLWKGAGADRWELTLSCGFELPTFRDTAKHRSQCHCQLRGDGNLRPYKGDAAQIPPDDRQFPVPFCCRLRSRFLCDGGGLSCGRGENAVHELHPGTVQKCPELYADHGDERGAHSFLQRFHPFIPAAGVLERGDVRVFRAAEKDDGPGSGGLGTPFLNTGVGFGMRSDFSKDFSRGDKTWLQGPMTCDII